VIESCGTDSAVPLRRALCAGLCPTASRLLGTAVAGHGDPGTAEYQMVRLAGPGMDTAHLPPLEPELARCKDVRGKGYIFLIKYREYLKFQTLQYCVSHDPMWVGCGSNG